MITQPRDPLLLIARIITWFVIGVLAVIAFLLVALVPVVLIQPDLIITELSQNSVDVGGEPTAAVIVGMLGAAALFVLAIWFFRLLLKIIDSVGEGDPFAPVNAVRLNRMAWISLGGYFASIPIAALVSVLDEMAEGAAEVQADFDLDGSLILPLVLFILARVFRHGAAMREDLEGTV